MELTLYNYLLTDSNSLYWQNIHNLNIPHHLIELNNKELILGITIYDEMTSPGVDYENISLSDATHFLKNIRYDEKSHNVFADVHFLKKDVYLKVKKLMLLPSVVLFGKAENTDSGKIQITSIDRIVTWNFYKKRSSHLS